MHATAIIQARTGSTRLPGKALFPLVDKTVLEHVIARVKKSALINDVIVATTVNPRDDVVVKLAQDSGAIVYRGCEADVLERVYEASLLSEAEWIVRVTADCPLVDPRLIDVMLLHLAKIEDTTDYLSNTIVRTFPRGLDVEIMRRSVLADARARATATYEREHVTPYIYGHPERYRIRSYEGEMDCSDHRWTLDTVEDWHLISAIFSALYVSQPDLHWKTVLHFLNKHPNLECLNRQVRQKDLTYAETGDANIHMPDLAAPPGGGVVFLCNVSSVVGMGHLRRCLAIAHALHRAHQIRCSFAFPANNAQTWALELVPKEFFIHVLPDNSSAHPALPAVSAIKGLAPAVLVLDVYEPTSAYLLDLQEADVRTVVIDDFAKLSSYPCTAILNHHVHAEGLTYHTAPHTRLLLGPKYALLNPEYALHQARCVTPGSIGLTNLLITMGGADPNRATERVLAALDGLDECIRQNLHVQVALGPCYGTGKMLESGRVAHFSVVRGTENFRRAMQSANVAISACGGTLFELARLGVPTLTLSITPDQGIIGRNWAQRKLAMYIGDASTVDKSQITRAAKQLLVDHNLRRQLGERARSLIDGNGATRVADFIAKEMIR